MTELSEQVCEACRADAPCLTEAELQQNLQSIPGWKLISADDVKQLTREYSFPDFEQAMAFTNRVGDIAEAADHHPAILTEWGRVRVTWWTHEIRGLHRNDLILAARTDEVHAG